MGLCDLSTPAPTGPALPLSSVNDFSNRTRHASVCGSLPGPWSSSTHVDVQMSRWALVLLRHTRCFQVLHPTVQKKSSHFLQLIDRESLFKWRVVRRSCFLVPTLRENDELVCLWRLSDCVGEGLVRRPHLLGVSAQGILLVNLE